MRWSAAAAVLAAALCIFPLAASAASVTWHESFPGKTWWYHWNRFTGGVIVETQVAPGLYDPDVSVTYNAVIKDVATGAVIPPGGIVSVGSKIDLSFVPHKSEDIYWFGIGVSMDSPYGEWRADATPPSVGCQTKDFVGTAYYAGTLPFGVYIPLVVDPPVKNITGLDGLSCSALSGGAMRCTVEREGEINPVFEIGETYAKLYYRYYDFRSGEDIGVPGCYGNNTPMFELPAGKERTTVRVTTSPNLDKSHNTITVAAQTIPYPLHTESDTNQPPQAPVVTPGACTANEPATITLSATDPEGDTVRYGIDWDMSGSVDEWVPASGYVASGETQTISHTWSTPGTKRFQALAQDSRGASSSWRSASVNCNRPQNEPPTALLTADPSQVPTGGSSTLQWSSHNADTCTGTGFSTGGRTSGTVSTGPLSEGHHYVVTCTNGAGSASDDADVSIKDPEGPDLCPNIAGVQTVIPRGLGLNPVNGKCEPLCPGTSSFAPGGDISQCRIACPTGTTQCGTGANAGKLCTTTYGAAPQCTAVITCTACANGCSGNACTTPQPPTGSIQVAPQVVRQGETTRVTWSSSNATRCEVSEDNPTIADSSSLLNGSFTSSEIRQRTIYTLRCTKTGFADFVSSATVNILPATCEVGAPGCDE